MSGDAQEGAREGLSDAQLWAIVRVGTVAAALAGTVPLYYAVRHVAPGLAALVPAALPHAAMGVGLFVAFPGMFAYARLLGRNPKGGTYGPPEYGVDDRWERRNL